MAPKLTGARNAVGYWGRAGPDRYIRQKQTPESIRVLLEDKLIARGKIVSLWQPVDATTAGVVACTCVKDTTKAADQPCLTCYGTKYAPGYLKFMRTTLWWASAEVDGGGWTLTDTVVDTTIKPNRIMLATTATTGTAVTPAKAYTNPQAADWEVHVDGFERSAGAAVVVEYSLDAGTSWNPIASINALGSKPVGTGTIMLRVTLTRTSTAAKSPAFEIARIRRVRIEDPVYRLLKQKVGWTTGNIIVARTQILERYSVDASRGVLADHLQDRGWTSPLDLFDPTLTRDTPPCRVDEGTGVGPHPFYRYVDGVFTGASYVMQQLAYNEQMGLFTQQSWQDRRAQPGEVYAMVW